MSYTEEKNLIQLGMIVLGGLSGISGGIIGFMQKGEIIKEVDVWLGSKPTINLIIEKDIISTISFEQMKTINSKIQYQKPIPAPIKKWNPLGSLTINI